MHPLIGEKVLHLESVDSTHLFCLREIDRLDSGTVVVAEQQTKGRGRHGRTWQSPTGINLYASYLIKFPVQDLCPEIFPQITCLAVNAVTKDHGLDEAWIKWPNDIYLGNKKIAGILAECSMVSNQVQAMVIGFGVNLNMEAELLKEIDKPATSILSETGKKVDRDQFLQDIIASLNDLYHEATSNGIDRIFESWKKSSKLLNRSVTLLLDSTKTVTGKVVDFNPDWSILIEVSPGNRQSFYSGDVSLNLKDQV